MAVKKQVFWIHPASFMYRRDPPEKLLETVWVAHPGWGYLRRRDLWIRKECSQEEVDSNGYLERKPVTDEDVTVCPHCGMYVSGVPGYLFHKHVTECGGTGEDWLQIEDAMIGEVRLKQFEAKILAEKMRVEEERAYLERKGRFDQIREDALDRQISRDRKRRLKEQTKKEWKER